MLGLLMLDTRFPRIPGDIGNPDTFAFPVVQRVVTGASPQRVVMEGDPALLQPFIEAGQELMAAGATMISTSCGFLALFQQELAAALPVPVLTSSLLQLDLVHRTLRPGQAVGVLTANRQSLTPRHLAGVGAGQVPVVIAGLEHTREFAAVFLHNKETLDAPQVRAEVLAATAELTDRHPEVGALVLECTNLPPYADAIRQQTGLPVYDVTGMLNWAWASAHGGATWTTT